MAIYENYGMEVAPPSSWTRYGEGDFLVQHWGKSFNFSKNGRQWYLKYSPEKKLNIGESYSLNDTVANDNDKIVNNNYGTLTLNWLSLKYTATSTTGARILALEVKDIDGNTSSGYNFFGAINASGTETFVFVPRGGQDQGYNDDYNVVPLGFDFTIPFNSALNFYDLSDIDDNDDMLIYARGWSNSHKQLNETILRNCTDLQVEYQTGSDLASSTYGWFMNVIPLP